MITETEKKNAKKKLEDALTVMVLNEPFFACLAMKLKLVETEQIDTCAVDGKNLFYNPSFVNSIKDREMVTVFVHEVLHLALKHLIRMQDGVDHDQWNEAGDHEINWIIEQENEKAKAARQVEPFPFPMKEIICLSPEYKGMAIEEIYNKISSKPKMPDSQNGDGKNGNQGSGNNQGKPGQGKGKKRIGDFIPAKNSEEKKEIAEDWERALIQANHVAKEQGTVPASVKRLIEEITNPKIDWKSVLRNLLLPIAKDDYSFSKVNTRYAETGFFLPGMLSDKAGIFCFAIDTSGSIYGEILSEFIAEAQNFLDEMNPEKLILIACDAAIHSIEIYERGDKIKHEKIIGGGGTDFRPVFDYLENELNEETPSGLIYLTDLYGTFPASDPGYPVFWITKNDQEAPFGDTIKVN